MMDAFDKERPAHSPRDLTAWNIEDLQAYIANLTAEIARCEKIIEEKKKPKLSSGCPVQKIAKTTRCPYQNDPFSLF